MRGVSTGRDTGAILAPVDDAREQLRYPVGRFQEDPQPTRRKYDHWIGQIGTLPGELRTLVQDLSAGQLDTPYRPGGWSVRQVVHHLADSHMNSYLRTKLALTEDAPTVKPYDEKAWAELPDARQAPIEPSLGRHHLAHIRTLRARMGW